MIRIRFWTLSGELVQVLGEPGESLMQTANRHGISGIQGDCGGVLACATCHIHLKNSWPDRLNEVRAEEDAMLELVDDRSPASRLSCQIIIAEDLDGLDVQIVE